VFRHVEPRAEDAEAETGRRFRITGAEAKESLVSLAVKLEQRRGEVANLIHGLTREWPDSIGDDRPPDLELSLFGASETVAELLDEAIDNAWRAADLTAEAVVAEWRAQQRVWNAERMAEALGDHAVIADPGEFESPEVAQVTQDVETRVLPEVMDHLTRAKKTILAARRRLPQEYPELAAGELSRPAVLHGDLGILMARSTRRSPRRGRRRPAPCRSAGGLQE